MSAGKLGIVFLPLALLALTAAAQPAGRTARADAAAVARNMLTPLGGSVGGNDVFRYFKPATLGLGGEKPSRVERPRPGVAIFRDRWDVPHVFGRSRADVEFGAGWATAEDRGLLMQFLRGPGRLAALDVPGVDPYGLALSGRAFEPSAEAETLIARQIELIRGAGPKGRQLLRDVDAYIAGINAFIAAHGGYFPRWTRNDVIAIGALLGNVFGVGGGDEVRRSQFLSALQLSLGAGKGRALWDDLRGQHDPETPVSIERRFPYGKPPATEDGNAIVDDGSFEPAGNAEPAPRRLMSNALLIGRGRSATGHPLFVAGPQVGYSYPAILLEIDLHGGGIDARGVSVPGLSFYVFIGRAKEYAWSATSAYSDIVDQYVETLCRDDLHYLFRGRCLEMVTVAAGVLKGRGSEPDRRLVFRTTVHGPVVGYATSGGQRVAISTRRATRGRELLSLIAAQDLAANRVRSGRDFLRVMSRFEYTFNWFYADARDIAMFSSGRLPIRAPGVELGLPTVGTGEYEWRGFMPPAGHAQAVNPDSGVILNWNNKPARDYAAADDMWSFGSIQRVELLRNAVAARRKHTLASVLGAMNLAATQDLRAIELWPVVAAVLRTGAAPSARAARMADLLDDWRAQGGRRIDMDGDGMIDHPGAAIMTAAWPKLADAVLAPALGPQLERFATLRPRGIGASPGGNAFGGGWYHYVDKDLRTLLGQAVEGPFATRFCGAGDLANCRASLWAALDSAGDELAATQGPDPRTWRWNATTERVNFGPFLPLTIRWTNRGTYNQVITFDGRTAR
jgi:acyl-homoserine lactone acylase PvdQ